MIKRIKMRIFYRKMKEQIYDIAKNADTVLTFVNNLVDSCKDLTGDELRHEFMKELAGFAHDQAVKEREKKEDKTVDSTEEG